MQKEELPKVKINKEALKRTFRLFKYIKPDKWKFTIGLVALVLTSITALAFPKFLGDLVNAGKQPEFSGGINRIAVLLLGVLILQSVFSFFRIYLFSQVTENTLLRLRQSLYGHLIQLPMSYFSQNRVGEINSRLSADISQIQETFTTTLAEFLRQFVIIIGGITLISIISFKLTLFMLALIPAIAVLAIIFGRYIRKLSKKVQDTVANSNTILEETMQGIVNVKAFTNEFYEVLRYGKATNEIARLSIKNAFLRGLFASFVIFALFGAIVGIIWYAMTLHINEGDMFSFVIYTAFVGASIGGIAELYAQLQKAVGATERVLDMLDFEKEDIKPLSDESKALRLAGSVKFDAIHFAYPSRKEIEVLKGISFQIKPGSSVAIVGESGAGKSTITQLLLRFYEPLSGQIYFDDRAASEFDLATLRNQMAVVPQDVLLFGGSIRENIRYGKPDATEDEIINAAGKANALKFIEGFPDGFDTVVGERGITLSGGQRQRIAIARAVLKDPSILILDEATSSLDSESERLVQEALDKLMKGRTTFIVAHRLSTIRNADQIIVLENGMVKEIGNHQQLIANTEGLYYYLSKLQFEKEEIAV